MIKVLLTGGAGFIGSHTVEHILKNTDWEIVVLDRLSYAGNLNFLTDIDVWEQEKHRVKFIYHDFRSPISEKTADLIGNVDYIIHMGAESHVDRSIVDPLPFAESNVIGTVNMLMYARVLHEKKVLRKFIYVSTDEVYGPSINGHMHKEGEAHRPSNPYSASKSGAEAFCYAFWNTYNLPVIITNTMNNYGERQNGEKFITKVIKNILEDKPVTLHCKIEDGKVVDISSRCWLHARNHADGLLFVINHGEIGERYNITGEWANVVTMAETIAKILGKKAILSYEDYHSFRQGHDMHYGLDGEKLKKMGWVAPYSLEDSLKNVVSWTKKNPKWL